MNAQAGKPLEAEVSWTENASSLAGDALGVASERVKDRINEQVQGSSEYLERIAESLRSTADDLNEDAPLAANVANLCADRLDDVAGRVAGKSATELLELGQDAARRHPALVFGLAAAAGFLFFRTFKARPQRQIDEEADEEFEGA